MCFRIHQDPFGKIRGAVLTDQEFENWVRQINAATVYLDQQKTGDFAFSPNIGISAPAVVIANRKQVSAEYMNFGLVPHWSKDGKTQSGWANSRIETIHESRMFKPLIGRKRCIIPVMGFYEFKKDNAGKSQAFLVTVEDHPIFPLAGIWHEPAKLGQGLPTFSIITTQPNALIANLHDRMPVVLRRDRIEAWLDPEPQVPEIMRELLEPINAEQMAYQPMAHYVNKIGNVDPDQIVPIGEKVKL